ncbi:roadblock/LC7 domain-containing protein [Streptomyces sp. YIM 98790]|uniref:roadblock/LC7 domain-containing protein n=1 Tax=Streptomyces sp. YIM 98790 TaxID=2689077 RepID=UPI001FB79A77|nr:roadblock/LC7 domain-containing protein [Streptomyces sp. YIM 98790]
MTVQHRVLSDPPPAAAAPGMRDLRRLLARLVDEVPGLRSVAVVSADGLPLLASAPEPALAAAARPAAARPRSPREASADLATVVAGLAGLTLGAARMMDAGRVRQTLVAMESGCLLVMTISDGSLLGAHTDPDADMSQVTYHMALFVGRAGHLLTPELRARLRADAENAEGGEGAAGVREASRGAGNVRRTRH